MKLFSTVLLLVLSISGNFVCITAYSQVLVSSSNTADSDGPRIFKALNTDLIFPKTFNSSENVISTTEVFQAVSSTTEPASTTSTTTTQLPWPYNHRAETEGVPIFVTPSSVSEPSVATSEIVKNTPQDESQVIEHSELTSTGRAVDYRTGYPFGQLLTPLIKPASPNTVRKRPPSAQGYSRGPMQRRPSGYAQPSNGYYKQRQPSRAEQNKLKGKATFTDRFSPSQATAAGIFVRQKENFDHDHSHDHSHDHNHNHANDGKVPAASDVVQSYVPPKNQYAFPPLNANYPSPSDDPKAAVPTSSVTSYLPPASGPLLGSEGIAGYQYPGPPVAAGGYQYPGPVKPTPQDNKSANDGNGNGDDDGDNDDTIGVLPASAMDMAGDGGKGANGGSADDGGDAAGGDDMKGADDGNGDGDGGDDTKPANGGGPSNDYDPNKEYPTPPPGWLQSHPESAVPQPSDHDHDHDHDHHHDHHEHDHPHDYEHDHHHEHDHGLPDYSDIIQYPQGFPSFDSFPEHHHHPHIIYDDHFPHYHHHHVEPPPPPPPPTTEPPPPPEPAPEPRVKKYSYFYIGRKLWYIPLYFTVWFSFYVLWLIIKSIARHKVNLPNHYVNRRSLPDYSTQKRDEYINNLTVSVLGHIDSFRQKYLT